MADEKFEEGVYGENLPEGAGHSDRGIREETFEAHPEPTSQGEPKANDSGQTENPQSVSEALDEVRDEAAKDTGSGGMGREGVPRNENDAPQGEYGGGVEEEASRTTPG